MPPADGGGVGPGSDGGAIEDAGSAPDGGISPGKSSGCSCSTLGARSESDSTLHLIGIAAACFAWMHRRRSQVRE
jgi:hypothetical protein